MKNILLHELYINKPTCYRKYGLDKMIHIIIIKGFKVFLDLSKFEIPFNDCKSNKIKYLYGQKIVTQLGMDKQEINLASLNVTN